MSTTIDGVGTASADNTTTSNGTGASRIPQATLGQDDFLQLLVAQLSAQDPLEPMKNTDFVAQMAQFSSLEQAKSTQTELARLQQFTQANAMLGRTVSFQTTSSSDVQQGVVSAVTVTDGVPAIVVDGTAYKVSKLYSLATSADSKP